MRELKKSYWNRFLTVNNKGKIIRDGIKFENLIEELLMKQYPVQWKRTNQSHDFNRDFHLTVENNKIWAECKNYEQNIALDTIAPTLVMAQIFDANIIIFFSYSKINSSARRKLAAFASKTKKDIYLVDERNLDELIIKNREYLPEEFQPSDSDISGRKMKTQCKVDIYFVQNPITGSTLEDRDIIPIKDVTKINYNSAFEIILFCEINSFDEDVILHIKASAKNKEINDAFLLLGEKNEALSALNLKNTFSPVKGYAEQILIKPLSFKQSWILPILTIEIYQNNKLLFSKTTPKRSITYVWDKQTSLIGEEYRSIIFDFEEKNVKTDSLSCMTIYGNSGTGKTRLLKEALEVLLRYKYKIISFIGNENDSARTILKEIIYSVYEVPRQDIFNYLEKNLSMYYDENNKENSSIKAYQLARKISNNLSDEEVIQLIDDYFDILFEKISSKPIAIVIDNVQFFSPPLLHFLRKYINYAKHQNRFNKSVLVLSINNDFATTEIKNFIDYLQELKKDYRGIEVKEVSGFKDDSHAVLYLRELLNVTDEHLDKELEQIAQKYSLIPYNIKQAVFSLVENGIIQYDVNNIGNIKDLPQFYLSLDNMPDCIFDLLKKRWTQFLERNSYNEKDFLIICSLISVIGYIDEVCIFNFQLSRECIALLTENNFLRQKNNDCYLFDHDIIEDFLIHYYNNYFEIFEHIRQNSLWEKTSKYPLLKDFYSIKMKDITVQQLIQISNYVCSHQPSYKMAVIFYDALISKTHLLYQQFSSCGEWLNLITRTCNCLRNIIGFKESLQYYDNINRTIEEEGIELFVKSAVFRNYINTYSDLCHYLGDAHVSIRYLNNILNKLQNIEADKDTDNFNALNSMIYNRLMINYREFETTAYIQKRDNCLQKSFEFANKIQSPNLRDEFTYLNLSDQGYIYYALLKDKEKLLSIWNNCRNYSPERLPQKTLNYYRKMIQLELIECNIPQAEYYLEQMQLYMDEQSYNSEHLVFKLFALSAYCICLIYKNPIENRNLLMQTIGELMRLSKLKGGKKTHEILCLKGIVAFYNKDYESTLEAFEESYNSLIKMNVTMHLQDKISLLEENIIYTFNKIGKREQIFHVLSQKDTDWIQCKIQECNVLDYTAHGIIQTMDRKLNLPIVV